MFDFLLPKKILSKIRDLENDLENYRTMVANTPDLLYRTDLEGHITFVSPSVESLSGYTVNEAIGLKMAEEVYLNAEERTRFLRLLQKNGSVKNFQALLKRKDGSTWWASTNAQFYRDKNGTIIGVEGVTRNVDDLKRAEEAQQKSKELLQLAFHTSPDSINLNRVSDGMFIDFNEGFSQTLGYSREETIGRTSFSLNIWRNSEDRDKLVKTLIEKGYIENLEADLVDKYGGIHTGLISARLLQIDGEEVILSVTRDITKRIQLEQQLQQAQKREALGILAGGIAHDFNNLLMGIQGRTSLIGNSLNPGDPLWEHVQEIEDCVRSATNLTKQVLGFARGGTYKTSPVDINALLKKSSVMFGRTSKGLSLHFDIASDPVIVEVDHTQFEQVFLNVFVNAQQAMPNGGDLFIKTSVISPPKEFCRAYRILPGEYARISITDTGTGMTETTRQRAFDPFFTTKDKERGTGLGLASVHGIIKNHKGTITLQSQVNTGTTVDIYLPLSQAKPPEEKLLPDDELLMGNETILLVDDEVLVTDVGVKMLELLGYQAYAANSGADALEILVRRGPGVDLVVLDLVMPGMDGGEAFTAIRDLYPQMPVLLSSGYSIDGQVSDILKRGCNSFIQKPFNLREFSRKLRVILDN